VKYLLPGDRLYAIGDMRTLRAADGTLDRRADLSALLRAWKQDRTALLQRFDNNRDGEIDLQEWQRAVTTAEREVDAQHRDMRLEPGIHVMRAPNDGRPFLLSNRDPDDLRQRYKWWAWFHLTVFVSASVWGMTLLLNRTS
jgi:phage gp36-like protein